MAQLNYVAIYHLRGISGLSDKATLEIWRAGADLACLTNDPTSFAEHLDRSAAIAHGLLTALFKGAEREIKEHVASRVSEIQAERVARYASGTFLVFHGLRDVPEPQVELSRQGPDFDVAFDAIDKPAMRAEFWPVILRALIAVTLSLSERADPRISKVIDGMFLLDPETGKPTYSFTFTAGSARVSIGTMLGHDVEDCIHHYAARLREEANIGRVLDQLAQSLTGEADEFRGFLAAWTALEMFVTSTFARAYEHRWFDLLQGTAPPSATSYFERTQEVMRSRHRLLDKFIVIASLLDPDAAEGDIVLFSELKKTRDNVFHESDEVGAQYPIEQTQRLLIKYLRHHLNYNSERRLAS